ncbi:nucleoside diphosphate-linked moiety X motif 6 isoform X2 [Chelonus insularis]|uniref:nucleoside diphosphate-linked moiety X motif 6 isoform X2 n=1 Tax=Chelonus insularis TaxID=460826 RepID=UPI0015892873|nr:nucleoside diphosphate-linked moiety X motif 6 isoform X2 [Chelonus insularis]
MAAFSYQAVRLVKSIKNKTEIVVLNYRNSSSIMDKTVCFTGVQDSHNASIMEWINANRKTIWFRVDRLNADWIPHLVKEGFYFHHAKEEYVVLYRCLTSDKNIPPYAHTNIGIGAFVINKKTNEVLIIKEKHANQAPNQIKWKLPGGYVEPGETLPEAIEREVQEETGIIAKFKSLVGFRHAHGYAFGCSDVYFIARLEPETFEIKNCSQEISECTWMKLDDYAQDPNVHKLNRFIAKKMIECMDKHIEIGLIHGQRPNTTEPIWIYAITHENEKNLPINN